MLTKGGEMVQAGAMSIRIREWGMLRNATEQPHISVQGLTEWESGAVRAGQGMAAMVMEGGRLVQEYREVEAAGELAEFSETLRAIEEETRQELQESETADWGQAWQAACAPKVAEALAELPPALRESAGRMAEAYNREASVRAWRDQELAGIDKARAQWQRRVDAAVKKGDAAEARRWVEQGRGVFVPEPQIQEQSAAVESRALLNCWQRDLEQNPMQTLEDYRSRTRRLRPARREDAEQLRQVAENTRRRLRQEYADLLQTRLQTGEQCSADELKAAGRAGVLTREQCAAAQTSPREATAHDVNHWLRRVDECAPTNEDQLEMRLEICTAALPPSERLMLLQRLELGGRVQREDRLSLSRRLWNLYNAGAFGCPGDNVAEKSLRRMQMNGLPLLAESGSDAAAQWLQSLDRRDEQWICFSPQQA